MELTDAKVVEMMREEWDRKVLHLEKALHAFMKTPEGEKFVLGVGTKVKHSGSGLLYTVAAVDKGGDVVVLRTPDGGEFSVSGDAFEGSDPEYCLD